MPWVKVEPSIKVKNPFYIPMIPFLQKWLPKPGVQIVDLTNYDDTKDVKTNSEISDVKAEKDTGYTSESVNSTHEETVQSLQSKVKPNDYFSKFAKEFTVNQILGAGSYGIVFDASNIFDRWKYAVKRIAVVDNENHIEKALREVQALAQFDHPGIIRYYGTWIECPPEGWQLTEDFETMKRFPLSSMPLCRYSNNTIYVYIQMQLCEYSLADWLTKEGLESRNQSRMFSWFKQIVTAVAYIHERGIIHRDLKPSNILFTSDDEIKICDMGIATSLASDNGEEIAGTKTNIGTPLYMAPEQNFWKYTSKVDVFSLGLILAELCVTMDEKQREDIFANYRLGKENAVLNKQPETAAFVSWLTQTDPNKRPTSAEILKHYFLS